VSLLEEPAVPLSPTPRASRAAAATRECEWSMVDPKGATAGVPPTAVLTADGASPVWRTPEG